MLALADPEEGGGGGGLGVGTSFFRKLKNYVYQSKIRLLVETYSLLAIY